MPNCFPAAVAAFFIISKAWRLACAIAVFESKESRSSERYGDFKERKTLP